MSTLDHKNLVERIYRAMSVGNSSVFEAATDPSLTWEHAGSSSWSGLHVGRDNVRSNLLEPLFSLLDPPYRAHLVAAFAEGNTVVAEVQGDAMTKSGKLYDNQYVFIFVFEDERIVRVTEYCDTALEERVLGSYHDALHRYRELRSAEGGA